MEDIPMERPININMTSFDEDVCVNQIRETGVLSKKFNNNNAENVKDKIRSTVELATKRFAKRKNFGSMCI